MSIVSNYRAHSDQHPLPKRARLRADKDAIDTDLRAQVVSPLLPVRLRSELRGNFGVEVVRNVVNQGALLPDRVDFQCTRSRALYAGQRV